MFVELVETGSYSKVAEKLNITQPAVSMQIKSLEVFFDVELLNKDKGKIKLTSAGKVLYNNALKIINNWQEAMYRINQLKDKTCGSLKIGCSTIPSEYLLPQVLAEYCAKLPEIKISIKVGDSKEMIQRLKNNKVDLIMVGLKPKIKDFKIKTAADDTLKLITPVDHHLIDQKRVTIKDIFSEKFLIREKGSGTRKAMVEGLKNAGINMEQINIGCQLGSTEAVVSAVEAGLGISFISRLAALKAKKCNRIKIVDVRDMLISRKFFLACRRDKAGEYIVDEFFKLFPAN